MPANADVQRNTRPSLVTALLLLSIGIFAATQSYAASKGRWADGVSRDQTFSRILVIGVSADLNQRCRFERAMAARIRSDDTEAYVSCDVMPAGESLTRESIEAAVAEKNADAVFATSLISNTWEIDDRGTNETRGDALYKATDSYYGIYGNLVNVDFRVSDPITTITGDAEVLSEMYETRDATLVYTLETKVRNIRSTGEGLFDVINPVEKRLRRDRLIR